MTIDVDVASALGVRGVTRVVHITPARNLPGILRDGSIRSVADMSVDARAVYAQNDLRRLDGHPDKVSCSLEYANAFYLRSVRADPRAINFPDWVCFLLRAEVAATRGALFCPRNAGATGGTKTPGVLGLEGCYATRVSGSGGQTFHRGPTHDPRCPTDVQAEVLVPAPIPLSLAYGIVFPSDEAAADERVRLEQFSVPVPLHLHWVVARGMFETAAVTRAVQFSRPIVESNWNAGTGSSR